MSSISGLSYHAVILSLILAGPSRARGEEQPAATGTVAPAATGPAGQTAAGIPGEPAVQTTSGSARALPPEAGLLPAQAVLAKPEPARAPAAPAETIVVVGTRRPAGRTVIDSPVAIDVLDVSQVQNQVGEVDLNQLLMYVAPSFNANRQSGADGADHIDPATLRGLGPDQTLVLVNGKRMHQSSLINIFGTRGRGNTGSDLDSIPAAAIDRIEILRDGASAQYGSDAIAGVINIVLKSSTDELTAGVTSGVRNARPPSQYDVVRTGNFDGATYDANVNYGFTLGKDGFANLTAEYATRGRTTRSPDPNEFVVARREFGDALASNFGAMLNAKMPLSGPTELYAFGGYNYRDTDAYAWTRTADEDRNVPEIYPSGFDPRITSQITDLSVSAGLRTESRDWQVDFNNTFGQNRFHYIVKNTLNATLLAESPTTFDAGGHQLSQNVTGLTVSRFFPGWLAGTSLAFGAEYRVESYSIFAGEEGSYRNYGLQQTVGADGQVVTTDVLQRPAGSQGFPGFRPDNVVDESRTNLAGYVDTEVDLTSSLELAGAVRFERYSDFGNTLNGKLAGRLRLAEGIALRASASTGFRAPSLAQVYYNTTFTDFVAGQPVDKLIAKNDSPITRALGIPPLKQETSRNLSAGITANVAGLSASLDAYYVAIRDRIVLTGAFSSDDPDIGAKLQALDVGAAQFFTNALDTTSVGLDLVLAYPFAFGDHNLRASLAGNLNKMSLGDIKTSAQLRGKEDTYFGEREQKFLLASAPPMKLNAGLDYRYGSFGAFLRFVEFGEVVLINWNGERDVYSPRLTTDLSFSWQAGENLTLVAGGENIFNVYPTQHDPALTESGGNWDAVQMGFSGAFYFARLVVKI